MCRHMSGMAGVGVLGIQEGTVVVTRPGQDPWKCPQEEERNIRARGW